MVEMLLFVDKIVTSVHAKLLFVVHEKHISIMNLMATRRCVRLESLLDLLQQSGDKMVHVD